MLPTIKSVSLFANLKNGNLGLVEFGWDCIDLLNCCAVMLSHFKVADVTLSYSTICPNLTC